MAEEGYKVTLNVYDLSQGMARQLSTTFLGKAIEAIWHTGIVVYGNEYYFGGGIQHCTVGMTPYGTPMRVVDLGVTHVSKDMFEMYLQEISPRYTAETYNLLSHNCNNFSNEVAQFLVGETIPDYILNLPNEVMSSPMGPLILPMIQQLESTLRAGAVPQAPQFRPTTLTQPSQNNKPVHKSTSAASGGQALEKNGAKKVEAATNLVEQRGQPTDKIGEKELSANGVVAGDALGGARNKIQDEISAEFTALMASGTLRASEAAALATRKVMQKYGHMNTTQS